MSRTVSTIDYKALAGRIKREAVRMTNNALLYRKVDNVKAAKSIETLAADLRTVVSLLDGMAEEKPIGWFTEDRLTDKSATTYDPVVADRWRAKGWPVHSIYLHPAPQPQPDLHCAHERFGVAGNVFDSGKVARPYGTDTMSVMGIVPMCDDDAWCDAASIDEDAQPERQPVSEPITLRIVPSENDEEATALARESAERGRAVVKQIEEQGFAVLKGESEPTEATEQMQSLVEQALRLQETHYGDGASLHIHMIAWAEKARAALAVRETK